MDKQRAFDELRRMMGEALRAQAAGGVHAPRRQGVIDGYMQALLTAGIASQAELLELVRDERARAGGPAVGELREVAA